MDVPICFPGDVPLSIPVLLFLAFSSHSLPTPFPPLILDMSTLISDFSSCTASPPYDDQVVNEEQVVRNS